MENPELSHYLDELPFWSAPFGFELLKRVRYRKFMQVLDIGPGSGFPMLELAQRLGDTCKVYGVDPWEIATNRISEKIQFFGIHQAEIIRSTAETLPFEDHTFGLIVSNNGLNNVENLEEVLTECERVAKPGAQFLFTANLPDTMIEYYRVMERVLGQLGFPDAIDRMWAHIREKRKTRQEWVAALENHGFIHQSTHEDAFSYYFNDGSTLLNYSLIRYYFRPCWEALVAENQRDAIFQEIEHQLNTLAKEENGIRLSIPFACYDFSKPMG